MCNKILGCVILPKVLKKVVPPTFPFIWTQGLHQVKKFQYFLKSTIRASRLKFYSMIYSIAILVQSLRLKKSMKEMD